MTETETIKETSVPLGPVIRATLSSIMEPGTQAVLASALEAWYAALDKPTPVGQWRLVIESAKLVYTPPSTNGKP